MTGLATPEPDARAWHPPSDEALDRHLCEFAAQPPSPWQRRAPLVALGGMVVLSLLAGGPGAWLLPWLGFLGLIFIGGRRIRRLRALERRLAAAQELATLRNHRLALRQAWTLVEDTQMHPPLQHGAVVILVQCLDEVGGHDAAIVAYDRLLQDLPAEHPGGAYLKSHRAIAALHTDRLNDADETLRRLRGVVEESPGSPTEAAYRFARLFQAVRTAHYAEGIAESPNLLQTLRPLGIDAGYGHALRSFCHRQRNDPQENDAEQAEVWWHRATTLIAPDLLVRRFPEMRGLGRD